jgi:hypothetical protein
MTGLDTDRLRIAIGGGKNRKLSVDEAALLYAGVDQMAALIAQQARTIAGQDARIRELGRKLAIAGQQPAADNPYRVVCPECGAQPGQRCKAVRGYTPPRTPHTARLDAARAT